MGQFFRSRRFVLALMFFACFSEWSVPLSYASPPASRECVCRSTGEPTSFESSRFAVHCLGTNPTANAVADHCEQVCTQLRSRLAGNEHSVAWQPKCVVVLHPTRRSYSQVVGPGGGQTVGSSLVRFDAGKVVERRIDLLIEDRDKGMAALPHEMVHVLLAEMFPEASVPHWAEEGLATLEDSAEKRRLHLRDLHQAFQANAILPLPSLFSANGYPSGAQRAVFYGQSMSVVDYLCRRGDPDDFLRFVTEYKENGYDQALATVYGIKNVRELEHHWRRHMVNELAARDF